MNFNFVFQDNLQVLVRQGEDNIDEIIPDNIVSEDVSYYLGNHCLVKVEEKWIPGRVLLENDETFFTSLHDHAFTVLQFPVADYFFTSGEIMVSQIPSLEKDSIMFLQNNNIGIQDFVIVIFPDTMPMSKEKKVLAEFWLATTSDIKSKRLSDDLPEILQSETFDFFRS